MIRRLRTAATLAALLALGACGNTLQRLTEAGQAPGMTPIQNPAQLPTYRPVAMPMPAPEIPQASANSLWRPGSRAFFKDQRAGVVGDILTVEVNIVDKAELSNTTTRSREAGESAGLPNLLGLENSMGRVLNGVDPSNLVGLSSTHSNVGNGALQREETIKVRMAAVIIQVLPNGNLVVAGKQEVRINYELRELTLTGVIRPEDITSNNTITSEKIAEARISYGGRGTLSDVQQPRYGQQVYDILFPF